MQDNESRECPNKQFSVVLAYHPSGFSSNKVNRTHFGSRHKSRIYSGFVVVVFCIASRFPMPNSRRWQQGVHEDLQHQAWLRVLQGRFPPSVQWPRARRQQQSLQPGHTAMNEGQKSTVKSQTMRTAGLRPFVDASAKQTKASDRVKFWGDTEGPEVDGLRAAKVTPIHMQVKECVSFLSRARLHMEELDQKRAVVGASIQRCGEEIGCIEVAGGLHASTTTSTVRCILRGTEVAGTCVSVASQTRCPRSRPRCALRGFAGLVRGHVQVPFMPISIPAKLSTWLEERHAELHDALRETTRVLELSSRLSEGAERLMEITGGMCS